MAVSAIANFFIVKIPACRGGAGLPTPTERKKHLKSRQSVYGVSPRDCALVATMRRKSADRAAHTRRGSDGNHELIAPTSQWRSAVSLKKPSAIEDAPGVGGSERADNSKAGLT